MMLMNMDRGARRTPRGGNRQRGGVREGGERAQASSADDGRVDGLCSGAVSWEGQADEDGRVVVGFHRV